LKRGLIILLVLGLVAALVYIYLLKNGFTDKAIRNSPDTYDLSVDCSQVDNALLKSVVNVTVGNSSERIHHDITVHITAFDANGDELMSKNTVFDRTLGPHEQFSKPIFVPVKTVRCNCVVEDSNPE
jgi:hypothetical protein